MPRSDYEDIKKKFSQFVGTWESKDLTILDKIATKTVSCRISSAPVSNDSQDHLEGLKRFVMEYPKTDVLHRSIYNYACRLRDAEAQQSAHVICESLNYVEGQEEMDVFYYSIHCANHWARIDDDWLMDEIHMDVYPFYGNLRNYFEKTWYLGSKLTIDGIDGRLPAIAGEYDLPWERIPDAENILTETEKVKDCFAKLYTSADYLININRVTTRSKFLCTHSQYFGEYEEVRNLVASLRYKRLKDRYWCHPYKFASIQFNESYDYAVCRTYRVYGWKQRNHEYVWTRSNVNIEHMCMAGITEFIKEDGEWKVCDHDLKLGIYETGNYSDDFYGDCI